MNKTILAVLIGLLIITGAIYITELQSDMGSLMLADNISSDREERAGQEEEIDVNNLLEDKELELSEEAEESSDNGDGIAEFVNCLKEKDLVIYGSKTCPACAQLAESFGGYEKIEEIYVECTEDWDQCQENKVTGYVPEIQIAEELYEDGRDLNTLAQRTGCEL